MGSIRACDVPADALTQKYCTRGAYVDCWIADADRPVAFAEYVAAFFTTPVFKLERWILRLLVDKPSTDDQARELASGGREAFAAWRVEARTPDQLLLHEFTGRTRLWLSVGLAENSPASRLYLGSVIVPVLDARTGRTGLGPVHGRLVGFHRLYSRWLLRAAVQQLSP
jgi:hypothetical protein